MVKTPESMSLDVMRRLAIAVNDLKVARAELFASPEVAFYLLNKKRSSLSALEAETKKRISVRSDPSVGLDEMRLDLYDARDGLVILPSLEALGQSIGHTTQLNTRPAEAPTPSARSRRPGLQVSSRRGSARHMRWRSTVTATSPKRRRHSWVRRTIRSRTSITPMAPTRAT